MKPLTKHLYFFMMLLSALYVNNASGFTNYTVTDLGSGFSPTAINDSGQVVGIKNNDGVMASYIWSRNTGAIELGDNIEAVDINNNGVIVGNAIQGNIKAFSISDGSLNYINYPSATDTVVHFINDKNEIAGYSYIPNVSDPAFIYKDNSFETITESSVFTEIWSINDNSDVVGRLYNAGKHHAFLLSESALTQLGNLGGDFSLATAINNNIQIIGYSSNPNGYIHAFLWQENVLTDLGTLGGLYSSAFGINESGDIVGGSTYAGTKNSTATLWSSGQIHDLNHLVLPDSGWSLNWAEDINEYGEIIGAGMLNGELHGFILTPIPEPATLLLFGAGITCLLAFKIRQRNK